MSRPTILLVLLAALAARPVAAAPAPGAEPPETARWRTHVEYLASDAMRGRQTGSPEHAKAAQYVAGQFRALGLEPAGERGSFIQPVKFARRTIREDASAVALVFGDRAVSLELGRDVTISMAIDEPDSIEAPLAFVGYGISAPDAGYDDLAHVDLRGKVAVFLQGAPGSIPEPRRSEAQFAGERWARLRAKGAIGVIGIRNPKRAEGTWERNAAQRFSPGMALADPDVDERQGQRLSLNVNDATAQKWFEGSGHAFSEVLAAADSGRALPTFDLAARVRARVHYDRSVVTSQNVVARLRGRDPALANEFVVLTAHLDHLGVGTPVAGDSIWNGAIDNASGVSALIEVARTLAPAAQRPKRSLLFVIVTGEEKGLLGSYYWTKRPTVAIGRVTANLNVDMVLPIVPLTRLVAEGADESTLGDDARAVATRSGIDVVPDPEPQLNRFIRSDQFNFVRAGVPALAFAAAAVPGSPQDSLLHAWRRERYHEPSDDLDQPIDPGAPAELIRYLSGLAARVADEAAPPRWNDTSYFRRYTSIPQALREP